MNISEMYSTAAYEVLDENTQKYTSTSVSGGGGHVSISNREVSSSISPITSTTHYHADQNIWVKNIETGKEQKLQFSTFNIDVRPGHRILCAWNDKSEKLERVINLNTGEKHAGGGVYNDWSGNGKTLKNSKGRFISSLFKLSWWPSIPFLAGLHALFAFFQYFLSGKGIYWGEKGPNIRKYGAVLLALDGVLLLWAMNITGQNFVMIEDWISYMVVSVVAFTFIHMKVIEDEFIAIKKHSDLLDQYLNEYIASNKPKLLLAE